MDELKTLALRYGLEAVKLDEFHPASDTLFLATAVAARIGGFLPLARTAGVLIVAVYDPTPPRLLEKLTLTLGGPVRLVHADRSELLAAIERHYPTVS